MNIYVEYFKYVMSHKKKVFKKCWDLGLRKQAIMHDMSKFLPSEFIPYAKWFNGPRGVRIQSVIDKLDDKIQMEYEINKRNFEIAVQKHYNRNVHHWNYWTGERYFMIMPLEVLLELICDWEAVGEKYGNTAQEYYLRNYYQMNINDHNRLALECLLDLNSDMISYSGKTIDQVMNDVILEKPKEQHESLVKIFNNIYESVNIKNDLDVYTLINESIMKLQ